MIMTAKYMHKISIKIINLIVDLLTYIITCFSKIMDLVCVYSAIVPERWPSLWPHVDRLEVSD